MFKSMILLLPYFKFTNQKHWHANKVFFHVNLIFFVNVSETKMLFGVQKF